MTDKLDDILFTIADEENSNVDYDAIKRNALAREKDALKKRLNVTRILSAAAVFAVIAVSTGLLISAGVFSGAKTAREAEMDSYSLTSAEAPAASEEAPSSEYMMDMELETSSFEACEESDPDTGAPEEGTGSTSHGEPKEQMRAIELEATQLLVLSSSEKVQLGRYSGLPADENAYMSVFGESRGFECYPVSIGSVIDSDGSALFQTDGDTIQLYWFANDSYNIYVRSWGYTPEELVYELTALSASEDN